ncbi:DUF1919 domain-containing protein [Halomonas sp. RA08-2]|uniref:DUF1919 domain-containing protein n=1 Tax=Halomonas sp. RA08-2 TaxID=3440842 RepID=UPI003EEF9C05
MIIKAILIRLLVVLSWPLKLLIRRNLHAMTRHGRVLISNNCLAGIIYRDAGLSYRTPTVGLYFLDSAYTEFCQLLVEKKIEKSIYNKINDSMVVFDSKLCCPVLIHQGITKIVFLHYSSTEEAIELWNRRVVRAISRDPTIIVSIRDGLTDKDARKLKALTKYVIQIGNDKKNAPPADISFIHPRDVFLLALGI